MASIEVPKTDDHDANNLVSWHEGFGYNSQSHHRLLDATQEPSVRKKIEQWAFAFYREGADPGDAFEEMQEIAGSRYDLLAYFMFLKDSMRFMPLKVRTFDAAFHELGIDLKTDGHCSWENYQEFMEALFAIHAELLRQPGQADATLVDAHSFCWLLVRKEMEPADKLFVESAKGKASNAKIFNAIENAVYDMVYQATQTAASSNGQQVLVTKKNKELLVSPEELRTPCGGAPEEVQKHVRADGHPAAVRTVEQHKRPVAVARPYRQQRPLHAGKRPGCLPFHQRLEGGDAGR